MGQRIPVTDVKDLGKIFTKREQNRNPAISDLRPFNGVDTETWQGDIFLIADSDGRWLDKITAGSVIEFLFHKKYHNAWNFFYFLTYDAEVILKLLGKELYNFKKTKNLKFSFEDYEITYIPAKCLRIKKGHHSAIFYDIKQFFEGSLVKAYQKNIGPLDEEYLQFKGKRDEFSPRFYHNNRNKVRNYCIKDCVLTKELAGKWIDLFHDASKFYPARWISSGYLAEKFLINSGVYMPKFDSIPYEIQKFAYRGYFGANIQMFKRGFIGDGYLYDINGAYPFSFSQIPDLSDGIWSSRRSIHEDAKLGFFRILADVPDGKYIPPFPFRANNILVFPTGKFETYATLHELRAYGNSKHYKILDSYQFIPNVNCKYPFKEFIENLYLTRLELKEKNDPLQMPLKLIINSIYGKTGETVNRVMGNLFNPVIFASITGITRAQIYKFIMEKNIERDVIAIATDSICTTRDLGINFKKLGEFSFKEHASDISYIQTGIYRMNGEWKSRGLGKIKSVAIEHLETFSKDGRLYMKYVESRNTRLKTAIIQGRISDIGKIRPIIREINLNADRKRWWQGKIEDVNSETMHDSIPLSLNHFKKEEI